MGSAFEVTFDDDIGCIAVFTYIGLPCDEAPCCAAGVTDELGEDTLPSVEVRAAASFSTIGGEAAAGTIGVGAFRPMLGDCVNGKTGAGRAQAGGSAVSTDSCNGATRAPASTPPDIRRLRGRLGGHLAEASGGKGPLEIFAKTALPRFRRELREPPPVPSP